MEGLSRLCPLASQLCCNISRPIFFPSIFSLLCHPLSIFNFFFFWSSHMEQFGTVPPKFLLLWMPANTGISFPKIGGLFSSSIYVPVQALNLNSSEVPCNQTFILFFARLLFARMLSASWVMSLSAGVGFLCLPV